METSVREFGQYLLFFEWLTARQQQQQRERQCVTSSSAGGAATAVAAMMVDSNTSANEQPMDLTMTATTTTTTVAAKTQSGDGEGGARHQQQQQFNWDELMHAIGQFMLQRPLMFAGIWQHPFTYRDATCFDMEIDQLEEEGDREGGDWDTDSDTNSDTDGDDDAIGAARMKREFRVLDSLAGCFLHYLEFCTSAEELALEHLNTIMVRFANGAVCPLHSALLEAQLKLLAIIASFFSGAADAPQCSVWLELLPRYRALFDMWFPPETPANSSSSLTSSSSSCSLEMEAESEFVWPQSLVDSLIGSGNARIFAAVFPAGQSAHSAAPSGVASSSSRVLPPPLHLVLQSLLTLPVLRRHMSSSCAHLLLTQLHAPPLFNRAAISAFLDTYLVAVVPIGQSAHAHTHAQQQQSARLAANIRHMYSLAFIVQRSASYKSRFLLDELNARLPLEQSDGESASQSQPQSRSQSKLRIVKLSLCDDFASPTCPEDSTKNNSVFEWVSEQISENLLHHHNDIQQKTKSRSEAMQLDYDDKEKEKEEEGATKNSTPFWEDARFLRLYPITNKQQQQQDLLHHHHQQQQNAIKNVRSLSDAVRLIQSEKSSALIGPLLDLITNGAFNEHFLHTQTTQLDGQSHSKSQSQSESQSDGPSKSEALDWLLFSNESAPHNRFLFSAFVHCCSVFAVRQSVTEFLLRCSNAPRDWTADASLVLDALHIALHHPAQQDLIGAAPTNYNAQRVRLTQHAHAFLAHCSNENSRLRVIQSAVRAILQELRNTATDMHRDMTDSVLSARCRLVEMLWNASSQRRGGVAFLFGWVIEWTNQEAAHSHAHKAANQFVTAMYLTAPYLFNGAATSSSSLASSSSSSMYDVTQSSQQLHRFVSRGWERVVTQLAGSHTSCSNVIEAQQSSAASFLAIGQRMLIALSSHTHAQQQQHGDLLANQQQVNCCKALAIHHPILFEQFLPLLWAISQSALDTAPNTSCARAITRSRRVTTALYEHLLLHLIEIMSPHVFMLRNHTTHRNSNNNSLLRHLHGLLSNFLRLFVRSASTISPSHSAATTTSSSSTANKNEAGGEANHASHGNVWHIGRHLIDRFLVQLKIYAAVNARAARRFLLDNLAELRILSQGSPNPPEINNFAATSNNNNNNSFSYAFFIDWALRNSSTNHSWANHELRMLRIMAFGDDDDYDETDDDDQRENNEMVLQDVETFNDYVRNGGGFRADCFPLIEPPLCKKLRFARSNSEILHTLKSLKDVTGWPAWTMSISGAAASSSSAAAAGGANKNRKSGGPHSHTHAHTAGADLTSCISAASSAVLSCVQRLCVHETEEAIRRSAIQLVYRHVSGVRPQLAGPLLRQVCWPVFLDQLQPGTAAEGGGGSFAGALALFQLLAPLCPHALPDYLRVLARIAISGKHRLLVKSAAVSNAKSGASGATLFAGAGSIGVLQVICEAINILNLENFSNSTGQAGGGAAAATSN